MVDSPWRLCASTSGAATQFCLCFVQVLCPGQSVNFIIFVTVTNSFIVMRKLFCIIMCVCRVFVMVRALSCNVLFFFDSNCFVVVLFYFVFIILCVRACMCRWVCDARGMASGVISRRVNAWERVSLIFFGWTGMQSFIIIYLLAIWCCTDLSCTPNKCVRCPRAVSDKERTEEECVQDGWLSLFDIVHPVTVRKWKDINEWFASPVCREWFGDCIVWRQRDDESWDCERCESENEYQGGSARIHNLFHTFNLFTNRCCWWQWYMHHLLCMLKFKALIYFFFIF